MPWLTEEEINPLKTKIETTVSWMKETIEENDKIPLHKNPIFNVSDFTKKIDEIKKIYVGVRKIKKPENKTIETPKNSTNGKNKKKGDKKEEKDNKDL